jgi:protein-S-isoprenylcysteine O-methyltransferase Ste14
VSITSVVGLSGSIACFASYTWAILRLFARPNGRPIQMTFVTILGFIFFLGQLFTILRGKPIVWVATLGLFFYAIAFALFWWAVPVAREARLNVAFTTTRPRMLLTQGPYRYIRHPFYASYLAFWTGGVLVSSELFLLLSVLGMGLFYILAMRQEEQEFRQGSLSNAYKVYSQSTGRILPRLLRRPISLMF